MGAGEEKNMTIVKIEKSNSSFGRWWVYFEGYAVPVPYINENCTDELDVWRRIKNVKNRDHLWMKYKNRASLSKIGLKWARKIAVADYYKEKEGAK
jgi:hypothetical protein